MASSTSAVKVPSERGSNTSSRTASTERSSSSTPTTSLPPSNTDKTPDDPSKIRTFLGILKRFIGVADMAAVRFSLPAQLLEPVPNLEFWHYLDRPDSFASIGDSDDPMARMLATLHFWFTKDLKYVKGKACKPYNSVLGEFFRCWWEIDETKASSPEAQTTESKEPVKVLYLTEQTSHHPPVSAFHISCPKKGITARGFDQLSANFTGTRIRVGPGKYNLGIFLTLHNRGDEKYHLTHPIAHIGGLLKGSLTINISESSYITCPKTKLKTIMTYLEEGWLGKNQNRVVGIVFKYNPDNDTKTKIKDVAVEDIVARLEGSWREQVFYTLGNGPFDESEKHLLLDLSPLWPEPKTVPPEDDQLANESRKFWTEVTEKIHNKQWGAATSAKQAIEEQQRTKAADRKARNAQWKPRFFKEAVAPPGKPELSRDGEELLRKLDQGDYALEPNKELGA